MTKTHYTQFLEMIQNANIKYSIIDTGMGEKRVLIYTATIGTHPVEFLFDINEDLVSVSTYQIMEESK